MRFIRRQLHLAAPTRAAERSVASVMAHAVRPMLSRAHYDDALARARVDCLRDVLDGRAHWAWSWSVAAHVVGGETAPLREVARLVDSVALCFRERETNQNEPQTISASNHLCALAEVAVAVARHVPAALHLLRREQLMCIARHVRAFAHAAFEALPPTNNINYNNNNNNHGQQQPLI